MAAKGEQYKGREFLRDVGVVALLLGALVVAGEVL